MNRIRQGDIEDQEQKLITIRNLIVQRNGRDALRVDALDIQRGETLTVVGPNGAGKSTLLLALARLLKLSNGDIIYHSGLCSIGMISAIEERSPSCFNLRY